MSPRQTALNFPRLPPKSTTGTISDRHRVSTKTQPVKPEVLRTKGRRASGRVETDVLMAIKPVHLAHITSRQKNHEYRKYRLRDGVERLWLYETREGGSGRAAIT